MRTTANAQKRLRKSSLWIWKASSAIDYLVLTSDAMKVPCAPMKRAAREVPTRLRARVYLIYIQKWKHYMIDLREVSNGGVSKRSERRESSARKRGPLVHFTVPCTKIFIAWGK